MQPSTERSMEFIWRRLQEPPELFGMPLSFDPYWWLGLAIPLVLLALFFVAITYRRESKTIGPMWSAILGLLRLFTYITLFFIWLLPAMRQVTHSEQQSKVALLFDVSASVTEESDMAAGEDPSEIRLTRQENLFELLKHAVPVTAGGSKRPDFLAKLLEKNPLVCYRFGEVLDPQPWLIQPGNRPSDALLRRQLHAGLPTSWDETPSPETVNELIKFAQAADTEEQQTQPSRIKSLSEALERNLLERRALAARLLSRTNVGLCCGNCCRRKKGIYRAWFSFLMARPLPVRVRT